ncbi:MAG: MarR family transcriptional regulator [Candidatus Omnitrophota bacterium]
MSDISLSSFVDKISEIMPVIMKQFSRYQMNELYKGKITLPQFFILEFLSTNKQSKMKDLAGFMEVTTAAATGIVDRLVRDSYIVRFYDPADRRVVMVKLTPKGSELVKKIIQQRRQATIKMFSRISEADRQDYLRILIQIKNTLFRENQ